MVLLGGEDVLTALPKFQSRQTTTIHDNHPGLSKPPHIYSSSFFFSCYSSNTFNFIRTVKANHFLFNFFFSVRKLPFHRQIGMGTINAWRYFATHRVFRIPKLNWLIVFLLGAFLIKLVLMFKRLYERQALLTMLVSNLLLYGLADTLAQTLTSILQFVPATNDPYAIKFVLERQAVNRLDVQQFDIEEGYEDGAADAEDLVEMGLMHDDDGFGDLDRQIADNESTTTMTGNTKPIEVVPSVVQPNDYNFRRLSLFMIWGMPFFFFFFF